MQIHLADVLLLSEKPLLMKPPHAYGPQLPKKSDTEEVS